ncbi:hypothetical protein L198_04704 [Cryptococcus wingfieldii CBS 7118]|uniref:Uncharacterized protein n=1 Tax=Cryptococcus wingfieldii CBS 7118 TaxID=1295528 RepID=A0A1E3J381_9TREE|nr:hypothetical protein L198_04704 [Cryptococcus wingfieldii CBS 7118]ODN95309.1 hypothetical protein L198_04704 [Cryptococcus wingfieldii CBS 7118]
MSRPTPNVLINRNLRPAGASGNVGAGASISSSLLFSPNYHHDSDNAYFPPLAIARAGGKGGQIFVYSEDGTTTSGYSSFAGGGRRWGDAIAGESTENTRESPPSYLHQHFSQFADTTTSQSYRPPSNMPISHNLITPPSSFTQSVDIPGARGQPSVRPMSLPLTPLSSSAARVGQESPEHSGSTPDSGKFDNSIITLITSIFPLHAQTVSLLSHTLEILTPPVHKLQGFIVDYPSSYTSGRTVFIHMPPGHGTVNQRPESLSPNFSQVLRPHDPLFSTSPTSASHLASSAYAFDIRESLTALLDLAAEALEGNHLVLVLERNEAEQEALGEMLHSLMYVGGQVVKPGGLEGGWEWDATKWVLVGLEL